MVADLRPLAAVLVSAVAIVLIVASHRRPNLREGWSVLAALGKFGIVASMLPAVMSGTVYSWSLYESTGLRFLPGVDFALRADPLGILFALLASFLWIFTSFYAAGYMRGLDEHAQTRFFASFAASLSAAVGIAFAANLVTIFVFYELLSLVTYPLVAHNEDNEARIAGRKYLTYTFFGGGVFLLAGTVMVYWLTASINGDPTLAFESGGMEALATAAQAEPGFAQAAFFLLIAGFGVKAALMPLHSWLADAMVAPTPVSGLLHAVAVVKSGAFGVARVILDVYGPGLIHDLPLDVPGIGEVGLNIPVAIVAAFTLTAASIIAMRKDHLKRRLAYSTTAQLSYIVLGLSMLHPYAMVGALFHIPAHAFAKLTLFFCAGAIHVETHTDYISDMAGIGKRMPLTMGAFTIGAAGMAGLPPIAGFVSKFYMLIGSGYMGGEYWIFAGTLLLSGVLNIAYFWPVVYTAFFESEDRHDAKPVLEFPRGGIFESYGDTARGQKEGVATDGGADRSEREAPADVDDEGADADAAAVDDENGNEDYEYAVDQYPSDHTVPDNEQGEHVSSVDHHGDHDDHLTGGPPAGGWQRQSPFGESTWLMLAPIAIIATGAVVLGVVPDHAVFLDLITHIVEGVFGVDSFDQLQGLSLEEALEVMSE
ncbi:NADH/Ubiquinone/plastoquinone (complex I) (plasmid) [Haloterrigena turkmenica DSM 5511]|uniref:NADH/Ubiquinone/plastoquinone (Complex I) n=1 Tax=Haloterrigena turkmenica (strain ATCC 51198 / DSM 5511 / JCM 9101 / NCIMB 13204 / VKM B-1734 / 4k) TaxID=543526 RepID=D2S336_HALTV|nr:proton-conducting transporter membrane subunit [Haloterrigena turkmenica]ADB63783.1 NADH/Ubiquinone/plastoquinone (complex I) [Haloterrigena turkmenica DSM 5511]